MKEGGIYHNQYGHFLHEDFVGKEYGQKINSMKGGRNWVIPMAPTPELWTKSLKQRTQILYQPDISLVLSFLSLKPGSVVLEAGTGSGSLSTSIARTIAPHGHLHTFEFNEQRQKSAALEFKQNGMESLITCRHRNIVEKGFPLVDGGVDAVFLDLPNPWEVIDSASINLKSQGKICSFSPCIEQVQATCEALAKKKFKRIKTYEVLTRTYDLGHTHYLPPLDNLELLTTTYKERKEKRKREEANSTSKQGKRQRTKTGGGVGSGTTTQAGKGINLERPGHMLIATPQRFSRGHTGYLTFATKIKLPS